MFKHRGIQIVTGAQIPRFLGKRKRQIVTYSPSLLARVWGWLIADVSLWTI